MPFCFRRMNLFSIFSGAHAKASKDLLDLNATKLPGNKLIRVICCSFAHISVVIPQECKFLQFSMANTTKHIRIIICLFACFVEWGNGFLWISFYVTESTDECFCSFPTTFSRTEKRQNTNAQNVITNFLLHLFSIAHLWHNVSIMLSLSMVIIPIMTPHINHVRFFPDAYQRQRKISLHFSSPRGENSTCFFASRPCA